MVSPTHSPDGLIVLLPAQPGDSWHWWRVESGAVGAIHAFDAGSGAAPWGEIGAVTALVPPADAPVRDGPMPDMPVLQALAAERMGLMQGGLQAVGRHVAVAEDAGRVLSCSVSAAQMDRWMAALAELGLDPDALIPASLVLPRADDALVLADLGGQLLARTTQAAFAGEAALVEALADDLTQVALNESQIARLLAVVHANPPLNLRQGAYGPRRVSVFRVGNWLGLLRMAGVAALLALVLMLVWAIKWNIDSSAQETAALQQVQARFPAATDLDSAERLLNAELAKRGQGGASFGATAAALLETIRPVPTVRLRDLGYSADGTLRFTVAAPRAEDVNTVLISLQNQGWKVTVPPALAPDPTGATVAAITLRAP